MSIKLTYEFVKEYIEKDGYELLSKKYINARTKLLLKCPEDHNFEITFGHFNLHPQKSLSFR